MGKALLLGFALLVSSATALADSEPDGALTSCVLRNAHPGANVGNAASEFCAAESLAWRRECLARREDRSHMDRGQQCDAELGFLYSDVQVEISRAAIAASELTPAALARRFDTGTPLPGLPDLRRPVFLRTGSLLCKSPGSLRNPNVGMTIQVGACTLFVLAPVRVVVDEPKTASDYVQSYHHRGVFVFGAAGRMSSTARLRGWVDVSALENHK